MNGGITFIDYLIKVGICNEKGNSRAIMGVFNLVQFYNYGRSRGIIKIVSYQAFYFRMNEKQGYHMSKSDIKSFFLTVEAIYADVEKLKMHFNYINPPIELLDDIE